MNDRSFGCNRFSRSLNLIIYRFKYPWGVQEMQPAKIGIIMIKYFTYHCRITCFKKYNTFYKAISIFLSSVKASHLWMRWWNHVYFRSRVHIDRLTSLNGGQIVILNVWSVGQKRQKRKKKEWKVYSQLASPGSAATVTEHIRRWNCFLSLPVEENLVLLHSRDLDRHSYERESNAPVGQRVDWMLTVTGLKAQHWALYFLLQSIYPDTDYNTRK